MLDPITISVLSGLAANVASDVLAATGGALRKKFSSPEQKKALDQAFKAGLVAIEGGSGVNSKSSKKALEKAFKKFFKDEDVADELTMLLRGYPPEKDKLEKLFLKVSDRKNLEELDIARVLDLFITAFTEAALEEPALQDLADFKELRKQTALQSEMVQVLREMVKSLRGIKENTLLIHDGIIEVQGAQGNKIEYVFLTDQKQQLPRTEEESYLRTVISKCNPLDLSPIDETKEVPGQPGSVATVFISDVFTQLFLLDPTREKGQSVESAIRPAEHTEPEPHRFEERERVQILAVEAVAEMDRLVILGEPGGGKSTLVNHICSQLAKWRLERKVKGPELNGWVGEESIVPVRVILRQFAASLSKDHTNSDAGLVWDYLEKTLGNKGWGCNYEVVRELLLRDGGIVFFDGLDEISEKYADKRSRIISAVHSFADQLPREKSKVIITCRPYAYEETAVWRLDEKAFPVVRLDLFGKEQIEAFTSRWYEVLGPSKDWDAARCKKEAEDLFRAITEFDHLYALARNPLLLTMMAQLHGKDGTLPDDRADLYERVVKLLLETWQNRIVRDVKGGHSASPGIFQQVGLTPGDLRGVLAEVAFIVHERQEHETDRDERAADIPEHLLLKKLREKLNSLDKAEQVIEYIQQRSGLLILGKTPDTYAFPHKTFQEYLAAVHISVQGDYEELMRDLIQQNLNWWREVFLLAAVIGAKFRKSLCLLVDAFIQDQAPEKALNIQSFEGLKLIAQALYEAKLVKDVDKEIENNKRGLFTRTFEKVQTWLRHALISNDILTPVQRVEASRHLALLRDPREEVNTVDALSFCAVPAGKFKMGSSKDVESVSSDELLHDVNLNYDFWISRFPITNAQYDRFVEVGGYEEQKFWTTTGWEWKKGNQRGKPNDYGQPYTLRNHPIVGITWYEAQAFTVWLTQYYREKKWIDDKVYVRLPSEAEWEKAVRGGEEIPKSRRVAVQNLKEYVRAETEKNLYPERVYSWEGNLDQNLLNFADTRINATSAVGGFPNGASPYGAEEMLGNVWEWTRSIYKGYPYEPGDGREDSESSESRVCRGGSSTAIGTTAGARIASTTIRTPGTPT